MRDDVKCRLRATFKKGSRPPEPPDCSYSYLSLIVFPLRGFSGTNISYKIHQLKNTYENLHLYVIGRIWGIIIYIIIHFPCCIFPENKQTRMRISTSNAPRYLFMSPFQDSCTCPCHGKLCIFVVYPPPPCNLCICKNLIVWTTAAVSAEMASEDSFACIKSASKRGRAQERAQIASAGHDKGGNWLSCKRGLKSIQRWPFCKLLHQGQAKCGGLYRWGEKVQKVHKVHKRQQQERTHAQHFVGRLQLQWQIARSSGLARMSRFW